MYLKRSLLGPYLSAVEVWRCPIRLQPAVIGITMPRVRTISMNHFMGAPWTEPGATIYRRLSDITRLSPSQGGLSREQGDHDDGVCRPDIVQEALVAGADGYLVKPFSRAKCRAAIQFAMANGFALGNHVKPAMLRGMAPRPDSTTTLPGLSPRQHQILPLLRQGMGDKEIASRLRISEQTVGGYLKDLNRKLGARNRYEALSAWSSREEPL